MADCVIFTDMGAQYVAVMNVAEAANKTQQQVHEEHQHKHGKASRIRGGGAGKVRIFAFELRLDRPALSPYL